MIDFLLNQGFFNDDLRLCRLVKLDRLWADLNNFSFRFSGLLCVDSFLLLFFLGAHEFLDRVDALVSQLSHSLRHVVSLAFSCKEAVVDQDGVVHDVLVDHALFDCYLVDDFPFNLGLLYCSVLKLF